MCVKCLTIQEQYTLPLICANLFSDMKNEHRLILFWFFSEFLLRSYLDKKRNLFIILTWKVNMERKRDATDDIHANIQWSPRCDFRRDTASGNAAAVGEYSCPAIFDQPADCPQSHKDAFRQSLIVRKQGIGSVVAEKKQEKPLIFGLDLELQSSSYHYYQKIIKGISSVAESGKHKLQIISLESDLAAAAEGVDGFILSHIRNDQEKFNEFAKLAGQGTPVVLINRFPVNPELSYISVDFRKEMYRAVSCLLKNGARNVLL